MIYNLSIAQLLSPCLSKMKYFSPEGFVSYEARVCQKRHEQIVKAQNNQRYLNLNRCAKDLSNSNDIQFTDNALPVTLEAISQFENLPTPELLNGVDLKILYETLANLMAGYPVNEIEDGPTKEFLHQCYSVYLNQILFLILKFNCYHQLSLVEGGYKQCRAHDSK